MKSMTRRRPQPAPRPAPRPAPVPVQERTQDQLRVRRRGGLPVVYRGNNFDLAAEVDAILSPLSGQIAALKQPLAMRPKVEDLADAVHELVFSVVGLLAEAKLSDAQARTRTINAARDLAQRPTAPEITDKQIRSGTWARALTDYARPLAVDLSALLDRAAPPGAVLHSASERLEEPLRTLDAAALDTARQIPKVIGYQALPTVDEYNAAKRAEREAARIRKSYAKFGIEAPE